MRGHDSTPQKRLLSLSAYAMIVKKNKQAKEATKCR